jgi:DNA primase
MPPQYDYIQLFEDYNIPYDAKTAAGRSMLLVPCPNCEAGEDTHFHGSIHLEKNFFSCWRCSYIPLDDVIFALTKEQWWKINRKYKKNPDARDIYLERRIEKPRNTQCFLPKEAMDLGERPKQYLRKRGFDPDYLIKKYGLRATGTSGAYKFRIIIPIYFNKKLISYQGRDYSGGSELRYKSCAEVDEVIHYKDIVYNYDATDKRHVIVTEGITDVWALGDRAVATFGVGFTDKQVYLLTNFKKVSVLFDSEYLAQKQADKLGNALAGLGVEVEILCLSEEGIDPGQLSMKEGKDLVKKIIGE